MKVFKSITNPAHFNFWASLLLAVITTGFVFYFKRSNEHVNTAIIPVGRLEQDFYDWNDRHAKVMALKKTMNPDIVLIGDSIIHLWGGEPSQPAPRGDRGIDSWNRLFKTHRPLNLGFGWDRTQNVLKRIELGELDGLRPKIVIVLIGTNSLAVSKNAPKNTPAEIADGVNMILTECQQNCPSARIVLLGLLPRGQKPSDPNREDVANVNRILSLQGPRTGVLYLDISTRFISADGTINVELMGDFLHPTAEGYAIIAEALQPLLDKE